jgi:hypothetical protein
MIISFVVLFGDWTKRLRRGRGSGRKRLPVVHVF